MARKRCVPAAIMEVAPYYSIPAQSALLSGVVGYGSPALAVTAAFTGRVEPGPYEECTKHSRATDILCVQATQITHVAIRLWLYTWPDFSSDTVYGRTQRLLLHNNCGQYSPSHAFAPLVSPLPPRRLENIHVPAWPGIIPPSGTKSPFSIVATA